MVRYSVLQGNEQLFASEYKLVLPTEEELRQELDRERARLEEQQADAATQAINPTTDSSPAD